MKFGFEGTGADRALEAFVEHTGVKVVLEDSEPMRSDSLVIVGAIVGIAGGVVTVADRILAWRDHLREQRKKADEKPLSAVLESPDGRRVVLEKATREEIVDVLACLQPEDHGDPASGHDS